jgi:type II secretory pathway pseudopilin PulG
MIAELLVFVIAMLSLLALVGGGLWRASRDRNRVASELEEDQTLEAP